MLVLARKKGESLRIGDDVEVEVVDIRGDVIKLGISAPDDIKIYRSELYSSVKNQNEAAQKNRPTF